MSKYVIYDNKSDVYTPGGKVYTAEEWLNKYPWAKKTKMVVSGGAINGSLAFVYDDFVEQMRKEGVNFEGCETDQDYLDRIEEYEDAQIERVNNAQQQILSTQDRIANALEDLITVQELNDNYNNLTTTQEGDK